MTNNSKVSSSDESSLDFYNSENKPAHSETLTIDIDGFEGPLDLLLALARTQKVDLAKISILALVEQYLSYINEAKRLKLEIAGDYLVMAAWLAFLKSRLLLPSDQKQEGLETAEELAQRLAFRLMRLEAMRDAMAKLMTRKRFGHHVFGRGMPEGIRTYRDTQWTAQIYDLLKAYAEQRRRNVKITHFVRARKVWSIKEARLRLEKLFGERSKEWIELDTYLSNYLVQGEESKTIIASSFGATLEMAREGVLELQQNAAFAPLYLRRRENDKAI